MATVVLPRSLVALFPSAERRVQVDGGTVDEVVRALEARWPGMRDRLCESGGAPRIRAFINVFVDGTAADLRTAVGPGSTVHVIPAVAGG